MNCEERIWTEDVGDGYSGRLPCGGVYEQVGTSNFAQCNSCKKLRELSPTNIKN